jgi:hypothetical protein
VFSPLGEFPTTVCVVNNSQDFRHRRRDTVNKSMCKEKMVVEVVEGSISLEDDALTLQERL